MARLTLQNHKITTFVNGRAESCVWNLNDFSISASAIEVSLNNLLLILSLTLVIFGLIPCNLLQTLVSRTNYPLDYRTFIERQARENEKTSNKLKEEKEASIR